MRGVWTDSMGRKRITLSVECGTGGRSVGTTTECARVPLPERCVGGGGAFFV